MCKCEFVRILALALLLTACSPATGGRSNVRLADPWARATAPGQQSAAAYVTIVNRGGGPDRLLSAATPDIAGSATLHSSSSAGGVMRMRMLDSLDVPARGQVRLEPSGTHIMLTGLKQPLTAGTRFELRVRFEKAGEREIAVDVVAPTAEGPHG